MIDPLVEVHAEESLWFYLSIRPPDIPIPNTFIALHNPSELICDFFNDGVLGGWDVDDYLFRLEFVPQFAYGDGLGGVVGVDLFLLLIIIALVAVRSIAFHYFILPNIYYILMPNIGLLSKKVKK